MELDESEAARLLGGLVARDPNLLDLSDRLKGILRRRTEKGRKGGGGDGAETSGASTTEGSGGIRTTTVEAPRGERSQVEAAATERAAKRKRASEGWRQEQKEAAEEEEEADEEEEAEREQEERRQHERRKRNVDLREGSESRSARGTGVGESLVMVIQATQARSLTNISPSAVLSPSPRTMSTGASGSAPPPTRPTAGTRRGRAGFWVSQW